jgi:hypothetical protein
MLESLSSRYPLYRMQWNDTELEFSIHEMARAKAMCRDMALALPTRATAIGTSYWCLVCIKAHCDLLASDVEVDREKDRLLELVRIRLCCELPSTLLMEARH